MVCSFCGKEIPEGTKFCSECGAAAPEAAASEQAAPTSGSYDAGNSGSYDASAQQSGSYDAGNSGSYNGGGSYDAGNSGSYNGGGSYDAGNSGNYNAGGNYNGGYNGGQPQRSSGGGIDIFAAAILCYFFGIIGWLISFLASDREDPFLKFHLNQSLVLFIATFFTAIPFIGMIWGAFVFICWIISLIGAIQKDMKEAPLLGRIKLLQ